MSYRSSDKWVSLLFVISIGCNGHAGSSPAARAMWGFETTRRIGRRRLRT